MTTLVLDATTKSIVVAMSGSAATTNPDFTAAWADDTGSAFTEGASDGALNGTNSVTLVAAPASSTRRVIKSITIENKDTAAVTITARALPASTPAAAAVSAYMEKEEGSSEVEAANMPLETQVRKRKMLARVDE